jgi:hypothetical protein
LTDRCDLGEWNWWFHKTAKTMAESESEKENKNYTEAGIGPALDRLFANRCIYSFTPDIRRESVIPPKHRTGGVELNQ